MLIRDQVFYIEKIPVQSDNQSIVIICSFNEEDSLIDLMQREVSLKLVNDLQKGEFL